MALSQKLLEQRLNRPVKYYDQVDSTNDAAKAWLAAGAPEGAVVIADEQTRGRGRKGRSWHTPPTAGLALSLILQPDSAQLPRLNLVAALSVYDLVRECGCEQVGIKWPNDVLAAGLKVSGILPEAIWEASLLKGAILGIGVNVRLDFSGSALRHSAISLEDIAGRQLDRGDLIAFLLRRLDYWYRLMASPALVAAWKSRLMTLSQPVRLGEIEGIAVDVAADGALLIRDEQGDIHHTGTGDLIMNAEERLH